ncbi:patatin-like phospholipase family protein [Peptococcaceae bacterium 1198_IL3148]
MQRKKKVGLALGGGFLRGTAHVGVLKVLEREGFKPDIVAGTSAGSIVAALYAAGCPIREIEKMAVNIKPEHVYDGWSTLANLFLIMGDYLSDFLHLKCPLRAPLGVMKGKNLEKFLKQLLSDINFSDLKMALAITAVDINVGSRVIFVQKPMLRQIFSPDVVYVRNAPVADAVRASTAVPGLFEPKRIGKYLLVDGGLREQVPAQVLKALGADVVLAVDVGYDGEPSSEVGSIAHLLLQTLDIIRNDAIQLELSHYADMVLLPVLKDISAVEFDRIPYAIAQGEAAAEKCLPQIRKLFNK